MMRTLLTMLLIGMALVIAACGEEETWTTDDADLTDDTAGEIDDAAAAAEATPTVEPSPEIEPLIDLSADRDLREIIVELVIDLDDPDYELVYSVLPERFQVLEFDESWVRSVAQTLPSDMWIESAESLEVEAFDVEEHDDYAMIRFAEFWSMGWVFTVEDDQWRFDPGDYQLIRAAMLVEHPDGGSPVGIDSRDGLEVDISHDDFDEVMPPVDVRPIGVGVDNGDVTFAVSFDVQPVMAPRDPIDSHLLQDAVIPLETVSWSAGGESGSVQVNWTNGALDEDELRLPGWPDEETVPEDNESRLLPRLGYGATISFSGVPDDAEEIEVDFGEILIGPFGDDGPVPEGELLTSQFTFTFPNETTNSILIGEAPEPGERVDPADVAAPVPEEELPPAPELSDILEFSMVDYEVGDDFVEAEVTFDLDGHRAEFPGPAHLTWDDGLETEEMAMIDGTGIVVSGERTDEPLDAEIVEVRFEGVVWSLGEDEDATFSQDIIETEWGDFPVTSIDGVRIDYQPAGQRYLQRLEIEHPDELIGVQGAGSQFDEDFRPLQTLLEVSEDVEAIIDDLPLPASVEVWKAESDVTVPVE